MQQIQFILFRNVLYKVGFAWVYSRWESWAVDRGLEPFSGLRGDIEKTLGFSDLLAVHTLLINFLRWFFRLSRFFVELCNCLSISHCLVSMEPATVLASPWKRSEPMRLFGIDGVKLLIHSFVSSHWWEFSVEVQMFFVRPHVLIAGVSSLVT